ncbi:MAG: 23S rRNA (adenine(2503)-C(2))-methyltransferase RlmN [Spirochaetaceae bacterium]
MSVNRSSGNADSGNRKPQEPLSESLFGLFPEELIERLDLRKKFRGAQLFRWLHRDGARSFEGMTNLPAALREELKHNFKIPASTRVTRVLPDNDGTVKIAVESSDGAVVESVLLQDEEGRKTACLSSQVGCAMGCRFCRTAEMGLRRNLSAGEIMEQLHHLWDLYGKIDNIVFMGMGEPTANLDAVRKAILIMHHDEGLGLSLRRITISTAGIVDAIYELAEKGPAVRLALSLITTDPTQRKELMPIAARNPLPRLAEALGEYRDTHKRRISLEYVVMGGVNSSRENAQGLAEFARPLRAQVNIIPWNPVPELPFSEPGREEVKRFIGFLQERGVTVSQRFTRGRGVNGACGQLALGITSPE